MKGVMRKFKKDFFSHYLKKRVNGVMRVKVVMRKGDTGIR